MLQDFEFNGLPAPHVSSLLGMIFDEVYSAGWLLCELTFSSNFLFNLLRKLETTSEQQAPALLAFVAYSAITWKNICCKQIREV
jgi:hypothetical protein